MSSVYQINKGINKPIEFRGFKAQYIAYLAGGMVSLLVLFAILYIAGLNTYVCLVLILALGTGLVIIVSRLSHKYGQYGLMKKGAKRLVPQFLKFYSRSLFWRLRRSS
jgi:hypothetical protein